MACVPLDGTIAHPRDSAPVTVSAPETVSVPEVGVSVPVTVPPKVKSVATVKEVTEGV